jgi:hypothetical protein
MEEFVCVREFYYLSLDIQACSLKSRRELDREVMKSPKGYRRKKIYMVRNLV